MSNGSKRPRQAKFSPVLIFAVIAAAIALVILLLIPAPGSTPEPVDTTAEPVQTTEPSADTKPEPLPSLSLPYSLENGALTVNSLFQSTLFNPDCGGAEGENFASLEFTNTSDAHLIRCEFTAVTTDGREYHFLALDVPAGQTVDAFEISNAPLASDAALAGITCSAEFAGTSPIPEGLAISVDGFLITLTNHGTQDLTNYVVHCHCSLDGNFFGGMTYIYPIETLAAGETVIVSAIDCYLGEAVVVRVAPADAG